MRHRSWHRLAHCCLGVVIVASMVAPPGREIGGSGPVICGGEVLTLEALAARRGLEVAQAQQLFTLGFTLETLCDARDEILRMGLRMATRPKPSFPGEYLEWRKESLVDEHGVIDPNGLMRAQAHVEMMREFGGASPSGAGIGRSSWGSVGPGNIGGRIRSMVIHPVNADMMLVGSVSGGIWKTTNGGTTWTPVNDFMANIAVSTMLIQPLSNGNVIYAGTGEGYYNADGIRGAGIFKSTDGGTTWAQLGSTSTAPGTGITAADFHYVNRLAMSADGTTLLAATRTGIFRSADGGTTFARATLAGGGSISAGLGVTDIDFHPTNNLRAVAGTFSGTSLYSTDGGLTWTLATGMPGGSTFRRVETAFAPNDGSTVYASIDLEGGSMYRSLDSGQTFAEIFDGGTDTTLNPLQSQGWYDNLLWVSPTDANFIVWGGVDNFKSTNGGLSFAKISQWFSHNFSNPTSAHADQHIAVAHPGFNGTTNLTVFFGNDGGVYRAADITTVGGGASPFQAGWTELNNGLAITQFYGAAGHPATGRITGGTQDNGTLFHNPALANAAENWSSPFGGDGGFSAYDQSDSNYFYGEFIYLTLHRNTTGGASPSQYIWNSSLADANNSTNSEFIAAFILDPNNNNRLLGGAVRLWRSNNVKAASTADVAWENIKDSVGTNTAPNHISAIAVVPGNSDIIYAGHDTGKLYKTTTGTSAAATVRASWVALDDNGAANPLPDRRITRITVNPSSVNTVYVTFGGFSGDNVYKSTDAGATWTDVTGPSGGASALPDVPVRDLEVHPTNSNWLYAGTEVGIFTSENGGSTWNLPHEGPSNVSVDELFFLNTRLYAVTHGRGIFSAETTATPPVAINDAYTMNSGTTLGVPAPGVLSNDVANTTGPLTASVTTSPTNGTLALNADGSFSYAPNAAFEGVDTFTYRAANSAGSSNTATVTITVIPQLAAPVGFTAEVSGNTLTLRWSAGTGQLTPDNYILEGGAAPGTTLATLPIGTTGTFVLAPAPDGVFYLRLRARSGALLSRASNEIEVRIGAAALPGAPTNFLASASGSTLALAWMPARLGGTLTSYELRVATSPGGPIIAALSFSPTQTVTEIPGVPAGTYYLRLVAVGPAGASSATPEVAVAIPGTCTPPQTVANFRRGGTGSNVILEWDLPLAGAAPTAFRIEAGSASGLANLAILTMTTRILQASAPPGTYFIRVYATNACGSSATAPELTIVVP